MLSRVAEGIYWMGRYVERAENVARFIEVNWHLTLDLPNARGGQWEPLVNVTGDDAIFRERYGEASQEKVMTFLTFDTTYSHSIISCLRAAREIARGIREAISIEMWEQINTFYYMTEAAAVSAAQNNSHDLHRQIKTAAMLFGGIVNDTMTHAEGWHFHQLGRLLERADKTSRILDVKYFILLPSIEDVGTPFDDIHWAALLRSASALEAYRHHYGRIAANRVVEFLLLNGDFPRSVRHCLMKAEDSLRAISGTRAGAFQNDAERLLGQLCAELAHGPASEIFRQGVHEFVDQLQVKMNRIHETIRSAFFSLWPSGEQSPGCKTVEKTARV